MMKMNEIFSLKAHVCKKVTFLNSEIRYVRRHVGIIIHLCCNPTCIVFFKPEINSSVLIG